MITPKQIKEKTTTDEQKKTNHNNKLSIFVRPLSFVLTVPLLEAGIKANTVSIASIYVSIIGFIMLGLFQGKIWQIIGVLLFFLWAIMDHIDGNIARYTGQASPFGRLCDAAGGYAAMPLMYFAMGLCAVNMPETIIQLNISDIYYVAMGGLTALSTLYTRLVMNKKMLLISEEVGDNFKNVEAFSIVKMIVWNITNPAGLVTIIMLISVIFDCAREFTLIYFLMHVVITIVSMIDLMKE